jgi:anti-anti-sigma regulatory factor
MRIQQSSEHGCVVLTLAEHPTAIICDFGQVETIDPLCAGLFTSLRHPALSWPGTALVLCGVRPAVADTLLAHGVAQVPGDLSKPG